MEEYSAGTVVALAFDHSNNGISLTLTDMQYEVLDSQGNYLVTLRSVDGFNPVASPTTVTVAASVNAITDKIDIRQLNVYLVTTTGTYQQTVFYKLLGDQTKLTVMTDSFMTYPESLLIRAKMTDSFSFFDSLDDAGKANALTNAYETITKLKFINPTQSQSCWDSQPLDISSYTPQQFATLPADMIIALKKAQIAEANGLVEQNPVADKIRQGIISETIGESSMFFRQRPITGLGFPGISDHAYPFLKDFLYKNATSAQSIRIGRA